MCAKRELLALLDERDGDLQRGTAAARGVEARVLDLLHDAGLDVGGEAGATALFDGADVSVGRDLHRDDSLGRHARVRLEALVVVGAESRAETSDDAIRADNGHRSRRRAYLGV